MTIDKKNGDEPLKVTLSKGNWLTLIGMMAAWMIAFVGAYVKLENRLTRLEATNEYLVKQVERLQDKRP